ncbi:hypothetical protein RHS01_00189 [Rhizoctonia solani]|uniref:Uncharacterized protein n=1 Tax=Rhizoctonia solani TaxID=456999 RepID=A0A8H7IKR5_9AGAM|nr:hypothetical protein RHS01_00189 [Rhizoctonia solani]
MATRSRPPSRARSPVNQGQLEPLFPPASPELGKVSLERVIRLLWGPQSQVDHIKRTLLEQIEINQEVCTNAKNISQAVNVVKDGLAQLQLPGVLIPQKIKNPHGPAPIFSTGAPGATPSPYSTLTPPCPSLQDRLQQPPGTSTSAYRYPGAASNPLHRKGGSPQCLQRQNWLGGQAMANTYVSLGPPQPKAVPLGPGGPQLPPHEHGRSRWGLGHPHLDQLGSHCALIQTVDEFKTKFLATFGNPDATRAAERKITSSPKLAHVPNISLSSARCKWNLIGTMPHFAANLREDFTGRFKGKLPRGNKQPCTLRELQDAALIIDNALCEERASHPQQGNKSGKNSTTPTGGVPANRPPNRPSLLRSQLCLRGRTQPPPRRSLCVKCGKPGHKFAECRTGWKATPKEDKGKAKETAKIGKDSKYQSGKDPQAGRIWKKANLTFSFDGKRMTETFLICNTGSHAAILGLKWLDAQQPEIDWNQRTFLSLTPTRTRGHCQEEEADKNPLEGVPSKYHQYAKSATLKDWLRDELKAGKIRPSKSSISSPVMFVPKKDGSPPRRQGLHQTRPEMGYNNVRVKEGDEWKTAFRTKYGLYESLVMTFGLTNAPAAFQHFMNKLFKDLLDASAWINSKSKRTGMANPTKVKEVQSFLGFANFLHWFVANFSHIARPLHNLVKKDTPWKWEAKEQEAFQGLKDAITQAPVLCHADPSKPYFLETNASGAALGSILSQRQEDGRLHPLGLLSESFKGAKQNYDTHNKELLAIIRSFEYWRIFLEGTLHPVTVFTNHCNLEYWKESRTFNRCHARWHLLLAGYNFQIVYCPGKQSGKPDALSRRSDHANIPPDAQTMLPNPVFANVAAITPERELQRLIKAALDQDKSLEEILNFLHNESKAPPSIKQAFKDYQMEAGLLFYQGRIVVPDVGTLRTDLLQIFHDSPLAGHPGRQRTLELISRNYYWPGIRADTYWHVDSCETCQRIRKPKYAPIPPQPLELPTQPWQHVSYNMIVDLPKDGNNNSILVIVDSFTKYVILVECSKKLKAPEVADLFLQHVWKRYGMPEKTVSDRGRVFNNQFLKALYQRLGIDPHFSLAYHPQSDGQTERVNPTVEHFLRAYLGINQKDWVKWLPMAEFAYNNAVHSATGKSPFKALYGWEPALTPSNVPTDVPEADNLAAQMEAQWREIEAALRQSKARMTAGETGEPISFEVGEEAWLDAKNVKLKTLKGLRPCLPPKAPAIHEDPRRLYVGLLSKVKRDDKRAFKNRPPPVTIDGEEEYEVEGITDMEEGTGNGFSG